MARHRRIEWAIARVPPTPPFWLKGGSEREVITTFFCRCCRRIIQKNNGMTSTLLTGTLFGLLDWCLQIRKSVASIQITKNFSNKYISIFYAPWQTSMFSIQISSQVHQKIALGLHCRIICATAHVGGALGLGKPLGSGPGTIRQFWNPIKPARAPAAAWLKRAPTTFWAWGSLWDRDRRPSVSFEIS